MRLDSVQTYHFVYVWVTLVYVAYSVSLVVRARKARSRLPHTG